MIIVPGVPELLREAEKQTVPPTPFDLDTSLQRVRAKAVRRRRAWAASGFAAAAAVVVGSVVWPADTNDASEPPRPAAAAPADPRDMLEILNTPREAEDRLPVDVTEDPVFADTQLVPESVRFLAEHDTERYWTGVSADGYACLLMTVPTDKLNARPEDDWTWYLGCGGISGDGMQMTAEGVQVRLVPDDYEPSEQDHEEWTFLTPNLAVEKD